MSYLALKHLHLLTIVITGSLFFLRLWLRLAERPISGWLRVVPHINDTVLLAAAIGMLVVARMNPLDASWLLAKIIALVVYIIIAATALKADARQQVMVRGLSAWLILGYIITVALTKQWAPWLWF